ncbi:kinase-like domain-containing protein [Pavlovales sp. CCMP2436]|nr:kinase-like domain-containing protein [Pavlovales sp. CCMP2436]
MALGGRPASGGPALALGTDTRGVRDATGREDGLSAYEIERAIGRGHFSTVHKATHKPSGRGVAIKKIQIFESMDAKSRERCLKEVELLQSLEAHPCIIEYIDAFIEENELYIIFEWAAHGDLRRLMRKAGEAKVLFDEAHIWRYFVQICDAIRHMHSHRIMHRDIKPANIFLSAEGAVKLGDLGLGRAFSSQTYEAISHSLIPLLLVGTPLYMSPEVLDGRGYEWKSDVWSLGVLLYELAALRSPFKADGDNLYMLFQRISKGDYATIPPHFSQTLRDTIASMLKVDAKSRPDLATVLQVDAICVRVFL